MLEDVHDRAPAPVDHARQHGTGQVQHGGDVDVELPLQLVGTDAQQGAGCGQAGVVDQEVDRRDIRVGEPCGDLLATRRLREVGGQHLDDHTGSRASDAAVSSRRRSRATSTRSWPSRASRATNAAPMPDVAPVIMAVGTPRP
jgi:hypothetical protein